MSLSCMDFVHSFLQIGLGFGSLMTNSLMGTIYDIMVKIIMCRCHVGVFCRICDLAPSLGLKENEPKVRFYIDYWLY